MEKYASALNLIGLKDTRDNLLLKGLQEFDNAEEMFDTDSIGYYWVGTALATGALQWIGASVMQNIFGSRSQESDIALILQEIIEQFKKIVHEEIESNAVRQAVASLNATQNNFLEYINAPTDMRLELTSNDCSHAVAQLKSLHLSGYVAYINAVSLRIVILQERAKHFPNNLSGELNNLLLLIRQGIDYHEQMKNDWRRWNFSLYIKKVECRGDFCGVVIYKNGIRLTSFGNRAGAKIDQYILKHSKTTYENEVYVQFIEPADRIVTQWSHIENAIYWCRQNGKETIESISDITMKLASGIRLEDL